jgi:hypothetical protein
MRMLNQTEKEIIAKMTDYYAYKEEGLFVCSKFLEDNYINDKTKTGLFIDKNAKKIIITEPNTDTKFDKQNKIIFLITFFNLLQDLIADGKIIVFGDNIQFPSNNKLLLGKQYDSGIEFSSEMFNLVDNFFSKFILINNDLLFIRRKHFNDIEGIRYKRNFKITIISLILAFITSLYSIWSDINTSKRIKVENDKEKNELISKELDNSNKNIQKKSEIIGVEEK